MAPTDPWPSLAERLLGPPEFTPREVAERAGVDVEEARRLWRALGFPPIGDDERVFTRADVAVLSAVRELIGTEPGIVMQITRVIGQSLARIADAQLTATASRIEELSASTALDEPAQAAVAARLEVLAPQLEQSIGYVWRRHLVAALRRWAATPSPGDRSLVVGFADLVGFTALSQALDPKALGAMVDRFEAIAYEHITEHGGRVVKLIGDEVMFSTDDARGGANIALALAGAHAETAALPDIRIGLASGPVLAWEGDLFGPTVNLASRLVNIARPNTVIVSDDLAAALRDEPRFVLRPLRAVPLKGFGRLRVWVLRRGDPRRP